MTTVSCAQNPVAITRTKQTFQGDSYYLCGNYFSRETDGRGSRREYLHRAVWFAANGKIPKGYHVHHIDEDRSNNALANLQMLYSRDHCRQHMTPERRKRAAENIHHAIAAAPAWHKSKAGKAWHKIHGLECWKDKPYKTYACVVCGAPFESRSTKKKAPRFCGLNCKMKNFRRTHPGYQRRFYKSKSKADS